MRKAGGLLVAAVMPLAIAACASPSYVLSTRPLAQRESSPSVQGAGLVLMHDRAPWVPFEEPAPDGSTWVHYALVIKNSTEEMIAFNPSTVRLESAAGKAAAVFDGPALSEASATVLGESTYRLPARFKLTPEMVARHKDGTEPLELVVPTEERAELRLKVWLWET
jgi:hypothetical protein